MSNSDALSASRTLRVVFTLVLIAGIFVLDVLTSPGTIVGVLYLAVLLLSISLHSPRFTIGAAGLAALLVVVDFVVAVLRGDSTGLSHVEGWINFGLSLFAVGTTTALCLKRLADEAKVRRSKESLENRVSERTRELETVVERLREEGRERERIQDDLKAEKMLLDGLMDAIPDDIYFKDAESRFLRINRAKAERSCLNDPDEAVGKTDHDFFGEEHAEQARADEQRVMDTDRPMVDREERLVWPDGRISWVSATKVPLRSVDGNTIGTLGVSRDITQHHTVEEALHRERDRLRTLIDNLPDIVFIKDADFRLVTVNRAYLQQFRTRGRRRSDRQDRF